MASNNCPNCGAEYKLGAKFCPACGKELDTVIVDNSQESTKSHRKYKKLPIMIVTLIAAAAIVIFGINRVPAVNEKTNDKKIVEQVVESYFEYNKTGDERLLEGFVEPGVLAEMERKDVSIDQIFECTYSDYEVHSIEIEEKLIGEEARQYLREKSSYTQFRYLGGSDAEWCDNIDFSKIEALLLCNIDYECNEMPEITGTNLIILTVEGAYLVNVNRGLWFGIYHETQEK